MKNLLFVCFLILGSIHLSAQDFGFGVKAGVNISNLGGDYYVGLGSLGSRVAFHLGGVAEVPITDKISVQPELLYSSQGSNWDYGSNGENLKLDYVNLPILGKYHILQGLSAEAGPVVGFLVSTNADDDQFKSLDIGFGIGASYQLANNIFFSLRYNKGIANINGEDFSGSSNNNVVQISAGYSF
ncbi:porin family protein [Euzebyella saccharophila]|uniref:Porin family protein n=1 Tax=Euzebyella saccharophila TaxID=679664 RepID=A0ABV8JN11_9FLAO|nr:porin family protein [Euzebyella saccharophila]